MDPFDYESDGSRPPPSLPAPRPPTATSLSALANSQSPSAAPEPVDPAVSRYKLGTTSKYFLVSTAVAAATVAGLYLYRSATQMEPIVLHGMPGFRQTPDGNTVRWRTHKTVVHLDASIDKLGSPVRDAIRSAFGAWRAEHATRLPDVSFVNAQGIKASVEPDGKNSVVLAPISIPGHERDLAITLTFSDERTGNIVEADIVINTMYSMEIMEPGSESISQAQAGSGELAMQETGKASQAIVTANSLKAAQASSKVPNVDSNVRSEQRSSCVAQQGQTTCDRKVYDVQNVLTHEAGHFFGLGEDLADTSATMYACTNRCETHKRELTSADTSALLALYPEEMKDVEEAEPGGCAGARLAGHPAPKGNISAWLALLATCLLACRRHVLRRATQGSTTEQLS